MRLKLLLDKWSSNVHNKLMKRVNVNFPIDLARDMEEYCRINSLEKSELVRNAVRKEIYTDKTFERKEIASAS